MGDMKNLSFGIKRKKYMIDGDPDRYIELDTGDTGILNRWTEILPWLNSLDEKLRGLDVETDPETGAVKDEAKAIEAVGSMAAVDKELREKINYLFNSDVCTPIVGNGSLIRTVNGEPIFYTIIEQIVPLFEAEISVEAAKSAKRVQKHTAKYRK